MLTPLGSGLACFLADEWDEVEWQVFVKATGESWWFQNRFVRLAESATLGVGSSPFTRLPPTLERHAERYRANGWLPPAPPAPAP